jgi:prepilin-type N-terminal cleavage/methylation domain-containing protein
MKVNTYTCKQLQKGYSLVELSVALSIVAVVIVAGLLGARQVMLSNTTNNQIRESNQTIAKLRKTMASQTSTADLTNVVATKLGAWPNDRSTCTTTECTNRAMFNGAFEYAFTNNISAKAEYLFTHLNDKNYNLTGVTTAGSNTSAIRSGVNYKF